ncbi:MAG TPA: cysteine--tRNA ligase [Candidatus Thermoplasmatota archaeon]|nr:cysteine--tRNA ligase [Candidatus Thermoplasmatota archaeon]
MPIVVTNTLTGARETFEPMRPGEVSMYVCGLTVYDEAHIGHARTIAAYDFIRRHLEYRGYRVRHVMNVTDVDDKIIHRARETGEEPLALARRIEKLVDASLDELGILRPHASPRVSEHIDGIVRMAQTLIDRGHAYVGEDEHGRSVYFDVRADPDYGKLSHLDLDQMLEGVRKDVAEGKRHPADFALWKAAKPGEVAWDSPWGKGRPGWHIECSVMSTEAFGPAFDIHGGGWDLIFPHHENELAQTESATGVDPAVKYWIHAGFLTVNGEKMSKSLGNFTTLRAALAKWPARVLRLWLAGTHYRSPIDMSEAGLAQAAKNVERLDTMLANVEHALAKPPARAMDDRDRALVALARERREAFDAAMDNDFNTPVALATLLELVGDVNRALAANVHPEALAKARDVVLSFTDRLGLAPAKTAARGGEGEGALLELLVELREAARKRRDFATSDRIRDRLGELGFVVEDTAGGPRARRK